MLALNRPTSWWGWSWEPPTPMSVLELVEAGNFDLPAAAMFWVAMERGASIMVVAEPPHSGKTTTVSALLSFTRPDTLVYFTRGEGEPFALPPVSESNDTYILVNETSDHIPVYTWDDNARKVFELMSQGYRVATTMHDVTSAGALGQLERELGIPKAHLAHLTFVVPMFIGGGGRHGAIRRIVEVTFVQQKDDSYRLLPVVTWDTETDTHALFVDQEAHEALADWANLSVAELDAEIEKRTAWLQALMDSGATSIPEFGNAIEEYYQKQGA